jgi:hypothetical protein
MCQRWSASAVRRRGPTRGRGPGCIGHVGERSYDRVIRPVRATSAVRPSVVLREDACVTSGSSGNVAVNVREALHRLSTESGIESRDTSALPS